MNNVQDSTKVKFFLKAKAHQNLSSGMVFQMICLLSYNKIAPVGIDPRV